MFEKQFEGIVWLFESAGLKSESALFSELAVQADKHIAELDEVYADAGRGSIYSLVNGLREGEGLSKKRIDEIGKLWDQAQARVEQIISVDVDSRGKPSQEFRRNLEAMDYFGIITFDRVEGTASFFIHPQFTPIMLRYLTAMDEKSCQKHMEQISSVRNPDNPRPDVRSLFKIYVEPLRQETARFLAGHAKKLNVFAGDVSDVEVEFLPTSTDFYSAGIEYYRRRTGRKKVFSVFSTTSGIFLPEEHYGSEFFRTRLKREDLAETISKNEIRQRYFATLQLATFWKPRVYYFEVDRARKQYERIVSQLGATERVVYETEAMHLLEWFLQSEHFSLMRVPRFPQAFDLFTLGNSSSVLLSGRSEGRIGHGFWLRPARRDVIQSVFKEIKLDKIFAGLAGIVGSYFTNKVLLTDLLGDLQQVFYLSFAGPLAYVLIKQGLLQGKKIRSMFIDLGEKIRYDQPEIEVIKIPGKTKPERPIHTIHDLFA